MFWVSEYLWNLRYIFPATLLSFKDEHFDYMGKLQISLVFYTVQYF